MAEGQGEGNDHDLLAHLRRRPLKNEGIERLCPLTGVNYLFQDSS